MNHPLRRLVLTSAAAALCVAGGAFAEDDADDLPFRVALTKVSTYASGVFAQGGSEISAFDPATRRLFVVNSATAGPRVDVLRMDRAGNLTLENSIDVTPYGASANSVAVHGKTVAIAVQAATTTDPGKVVFFDTKLRFLSQVTVGALPDMVTFTPNGRLVLAANEGEPNDAYTIDPAGSVSIIDVRRGAKKVTDADVTTVGFAAFAGTNLDPSIRVFGPNATITEDAEPEYIAVSPDSKTAYVTIQECNALATIDLATKTITSLRGLGFAEHGRITASVKLVNFPAMPDLGTTAAGQVIKLGGFSGLHFRGIDSATGRLRFVTHTDRGPNADPVDVNADQVNDRPFALPSFQPRLIDFEYDPSNDEITLGAQTLLTRTDGTTPITGISNLLGSPGLANSDEPPVTPAGAAIPLDPLGADLEGIVIAPDGTYWMCDEYRPSIYHFSATGALIERFVPTGSGSATGTEALPADYAKRRANRGFEAIALRGTKVYGFVQSPLDNPDVANDANSKASRFVRIVEFDTVSKTTTAEYYYVQEAGSDKLGDAIAVGTNEFLVIERDDDTTAASKKKIFRISLAGATRINTVNPAVYTGGTLEKTPLADLLTAGVRPVLKDVYVDLAAAGYVGVDKAEGLAFVDENTLVVVNDNDFGMDGTINVSAGTVGIRTSAPIVLGIVKLEKHGIDASDKDGANIRPWNRVFGMYQPDTISAFRAKDKQTYLVMANEGDARGYTGLNEEKRVKDITLDPTAFPQAAVLRNDSNLGRLTITNTKGDTDNDGDFDELYVFGTRSFSIRDTAGAIVWDSGESLEQITLAELGAANFNSNNDANASADSRSDNKGPEPEGLCVGEVNGRTYAFVGLERIGGVAVYDVTVPAAPVFLEYVNPRDFAGDAAAGTAGDLGPEGLTFVPASKSPLRKPLVIVTNEISGTTTVFRVDRIRRDRTRGGR